jgi:hypothetical protein
MAKTFRYREEPNPKNQTPTFLWNLALGIWFFYFGGLSLSK